MSQRGIPSDTKIEIFLTDDGCTDGTAEKVLALYPEAHILKGNGKLFWCGGMRLAWNASKAFDPDFYLLLNDDTALESNALCKLLEIVHSSQSLCIAVAAIKNPKTERIAYGGVRGKFFARVEPKGYPELCDTLNMNCALVTRAVCKKLGTLHSRYTHSMGDFDYGLKATRMGIAVIQSGEFLGICAENSMTGTWRDTNLPRFQRWKLLNSPKGLPLGEWLVFCFRNLGWQWPLRFLSPYIKVIFGT